jgi:hypothetical protein
MKKLLALMLVLGLSVAANATLSIRVDGVDVGATIDLEDITSSTVIGIYSDTGGYSPFGYIIVEEGGSGSLVNGAETTDAGDGILAYTSAYSEDDWGVGYEWSAANNPPNTSNADTIWFTYNLTDAAKDDVISLWVDPEYDTAEDTLTIIPEPMTIALLGLGGLLLRRRK